jgi:folate-binding protein YgfZ
VSRLDAASLCAVADRSDLGRILSVGPDLLGLLHRLSTGDVKGLRPGEGRETVVTSAKGRIVERLFVHHFGDQGVLLIAGPGASPRVLAHLRKFTFAENTGLSDLTDETCAFALIGPKWADAAREAGIPELPPCGCAALTLAGVGVRAARTNGFDTNGILVIGPRGEASIVRAALLAAAAALGGGAIDAGGLEAWRILRGHPSPGHELTDDFNPLEAGLREAVSFTKGCYVGQEVVARLNTYGKVSRTLVVLELPAGDAVPAPGSSIVKAGAAIGTVTSAVLPPGYPGPVALGYVKSRELADDAPLFVDVGGSPKSAKVVRR